MENDIKKTRDFYSMKSNAKILQHEFGYFSLGRWIREGHINSGSDIKSICNLDGPGIFYFGELGWCEAPFVPCFEEKVLKDLGEYELVQDHAGRHVLCFKGRRSGFMPEYVDHPVKDEYTWEQVKQRLSPDTPERYNNTNILGNRMKELAGKGAMIGQQVVGGYMYLRSLVGPTEILYMVIDNPKLVHAMMETWFEVADKVIAKHQEFITLDELFLAEDICYNHGPLISPDMMREFLLPYYQELIKNIKSRQLEKTRHLFIQIDSDGDCRPVIDIYKEIGADYFSPFEVASGCDVVAIAKQYPEMLMRGGIDKRILAQGKDAIDREIDRIMPFMSKRGGYIPTSDHGVPEEVSFENYVHYRKRLSEF